MDKSKEALQKRVADLEEKVQHLRVSRRVLMNLVEKLEKERKEELDQMERLNRRLRQFNSKFAKDIVEKNSRIVELEKELE